MPGDVVLLSTADWDNPFWTNKQHVAVELARRGHRVFYIDSLGLRRPMASRQDARRIFRRLFKALRPPRQVGARLWVWSPVVIPFQSHALARSINRAVLTAGLFLWLRLLRLHDPILWTYSPMTTRLFPLTRFRRIVYHCVDEIKAQPGMPIEVIESAETELIAQAKICFVTSENLYTSRKALNSNTHYFPNVADFAHFSTALDASTVIPGELQALPRPIIGFIGAITSYKVDFELLLQVCTAHPEWSVVMIGQIGEGDPSTTAAALPSSPNLHLLGPRNYAQLPGYLKAFDVAILPSVLNEYTRSMFPMKFFEYLAAGKPVVATDLHALQAFREYVHLSSDGPNFIAGIERALRGDCATLAQRLRLAREQTYERRTAKMLALLNTSPPE